jgi:hypothetical protein
MVNAFQRASGSPTSRKPTVNTVVTVWYSASRGESPSAR